MDLDFPQIQISQPFLFDYADVITNAVELFPAVWSAAEDLTSPENNLRRSGLARLREVNAPRVSPLVAYLVSTRLDDPDLYLRSQIVETVGELLLPDEDGFSAPENVRRHLLTHLSSLRRRTLYALLEVAAAYPEMDSHLFHILKVCPQAGGHLCDILSNRQAPLAVRKQAIHFIGFVGYLDAAPMLEKLATRLESRLMGQQSMSFVGPGSAAEEAELLPEIEKVLGLLKAP
jgi:hypothetical protein